MVSKGEVRRVFPGGNTSQGFYSFYDNIVGLTANRIFVIKGGPGVGKSSFMKKIAQSLVDMGVDVEYHHCSSDNASIDGIYVEEHDIALIDGTAPHIVDPKTPGAVDEIIHLGDYWDEGALRAKKAEILACNREVKRLFGRAYQSIAAAKLFHDQFESHYLDSGSLDIVGLNRLAAELEATLLGDAEFSSPPRERHLFATALTPDAYRGYLGTIFDRAQRRVILRGPAGTGKSTLTKRVGEAALRRGCYVEFFHCPLDPSRIDHVYIRKLHVGIVNGEAPHVYEPKAGDRVIDTAQYVDSNRLEVYQTEMGRSRELYETCMEHAFQYLHRAKSVHDEMEKHYVASMDFEAVESRRADVMERILGLMGKAWRRSVENAVAPPSAPQASANA